MLSCLYLCLYPACGRFFSWDDWLTWARVPMSSVTPAPSQRGDFRAAASSLDLPAHAPQLPAGRGSCWDWAGVSLTSCIPSLLLVVCLEAAALRPPCTMSTHQGPVTRVRQGASEGGTEVKCTHHPCPVNLGVEAAAMQGREAAWNGRLEFECWPFAKTAVDSGPRGCFYFLFP